MTYSAVHFNRNTGDIHLWAYDENGKKQHSKQKAPLYFYTKSDTGDFTSIYGDKLKRVSFDNYNKFKETRDMFKSAGRPLFESDIDIDNRFIMDKYIGQDLKIPKFDIHYIDIEVHSEKGFPKAELAEHPVTIITVYSTKQKKYYIFAERDFDRKFLEGKEHWVKIFETEQELLKTFIGFIRKTHPDVITGWNSNGFDIPYIINRSIKLLGEEVTKKISPVNYIKKITKKLRFGKTQEIYEIPGINCIDYLDLYKKYHQGEQESFKLGYIAKVELGETKLEFKGTLKDLYRNQWQTYAEYNVQDVVLLVKLDERIQFMNLMFGICYGCRVPFNNFQKTTKILDGAFISRLMIDKVVLPDVQYSEEGEDQYIGAYVKDPRIGVYDWVISFDATSLYPSIMMQHNISPETKVMVINEAAVQIILNKLEGKEVDENEFNLHATADLKCHEVYKLIKENNYTVASNGAVYRHDKKGVVAAFVKEWFDKRKLHKKLMETALSENNKDEAQLQKGLQHNYKILINSVYGFIGSKYARLYDKDNAVAVTATGQEALKTTMHSIDLFFKEKWPTINMSNREKAVSIDNTVCYGDTDSCYIDGGAILKSINYPHFNDREKATEFLDKRICDVIFKVINNAMNVFTTKRMNCDICLISFKREMIARRAVFLAKKRYAAWVYVMETKTIPEGDSHEIEAKGIEMVKSSTPEIVRDCMRSYILSFLKNVNEKMSNDEIKSIYERFKTVSVEKIAKITNVNNIAQYTGADGQPIKGTPYHVKGAIGYNNLLIEKGLDDYEPIYEGDKVKLVYIKQSPFYSSNTIVFKDTLPDELGLNDLVDRDIMWNKVFIEPIKTFYDVIGWQMPNFDQEDISDLFG